MTSHRTMGDWIQMYALSLFVALLLPVYSATGQTQPLSDAEQSRLDARFQAVVAEAYPDAGLSATGMTPEPVEGGELAKDGQTRYGAAIYTTDPQAVEAEGISVNSVENDFVTARVTASELLTLARSGDVSWVDSGMELKPTNDVTAGATGAEALKNGAVKDTSYTGNGVMTCVIDTGIDWEHDDFRTGSNLGNSKIEYIWDQTLSAQSGEQTPSQRGDSDLSGFDFGVEYSKSEIESDFGASSPDVRSEDTDGHGTHVAGTAVSTGNAQGKYEGMAPESDLIVVKAGNGSFSFANVIDGMNYCGEVADDEGKPVVVNMSLGSPVGPHDGTSAVAQAVDNFSGSGQLPVVSAGNDGDSGIHYQNSIQASGSLSFDFDVSSYSAQSGADNDDAQFDIWFDTADSVTVTVSSPNGNSHTVPPDSASVEPTVDGAISLSNQVNSVNGDRNIDIRIFDQDASQPPAQGTWTITFTDNSGNGNSFHSWFYDQDINDDQNINAEYASSVNNDSRFTIGTPGTATSALTVGAWSHRQRWYDNSGNSQGNPRIVGSSNTDDIATFSSVGPRRDGALKPEISAPGDWTASALSADASPIDSRFALPGGDHHLLRGTSMSSPAAAGAAALLFEEDGTLSGSRIKNLFANQAEEDSFTGATPNNTWGHGKLDVFRAMAELTGAKVPEREMLAYDENSSSTSRPEQQVGGSSSPEKAAVRITPGISGSVTGTLLHLSTGDANQLGSDSLNVEVWDDDGNGLPGTKQGNTVKVPGDALSNHSWNYIPLTGTGVSVMDSTDYHVVVYPDNPSTSLRILAESQSVDGRSSVLTSGSTSRLERYQRDDSDEWTPPKSRRQASWGTLSGKDLAVRTFVSSTQPTDLNVRLSSTDFTLLDPTLPTPVRFVTSVSVENNGEPVQNLTDADFTVSEENTNIPITGNPNKSCQLTPPGQGGGSRLADIVFVFDNSGSMGGEQTEAENNIERFVDELRTQGVETALGLTRYGQDSFGDAGQTDGGPIFENGGNLVVDDTFFKNQVLTQNIASGTDEPGYFAIEQSVSNFTFRSGAPNIFVVLTDETPAQETSLADVNDAEQALLSEGVTLYSVTETTHFPDFKPLTDATGGRNFEIARGSGTKWVNDIISGISGQTATTYILTCRSASDFEGSNLSTVKRQVDVTAAASGVTASDQTTYDISERPRVTVSSQLKQVASSQQPSDQDLGIETDIQLFSGGSSNTNSLSKQNVNAEIFYRVAGNNTYQSAPMSNTQGDTFSGAIPSSDVSSPGMEFYIQATDGDGDRVTLPSSNAATDPLRTAVAPNEPPTVQHDLVKKTTPGQDATLTAEVSDDGSVAGVTLFYRDQGDLTYSSMDMSNTSGDTYEATISGNEITDAGIEYYIEAEDDFGVTNSEGFGDDPLVELNEPGIVAPAPSTRSLGLTTDPEITFNSVFRASEYELQWSKDSSFPSSDTETTTLTDTTTTLSGLDAGATYYWRARPIRDAAGPYSDTTEFETYADQIQTSVSQTFPDASQSSSYRLLALPGDRSTQLESPLDGTNGEAWQAYRDAGQNGGLESFEDGQASDFTFEPGAGYWVLSKNNVSVSDTKSTVDIGNDAGDFETTIPLNDGWNIISNPLDKDVSWSAVEQANGGSLQALWTFDGSYSQASTLTSAAQGEAFYFNNDSGLSELTIPYPASPSSSGGSSSKQKGEPVLVLETFQDGEKTSVAKAGLREAAEDGLDRLDQFAPPARFEASSLRFVVNEDDGDYGPRQKLLAHEYRSAPAEDEASDGHAFDVRLTATPNEAVQVKASGVDAFEGQEIVLLNPSTGQSHDLRGEDPIRLTPTTETTSMRLLVGDAAFVKSKKNKVIPEQVELRGNYPNPFAQQTTITYALPERQQHRIEVYDVMGRRVAVLEDGRKSAGVHRVRWSGKAQGNRPVSSGVYLIRLETEQSTQTTKMTVVR